MAVQKRDREEGAGIRLPEARTAADDPKEVWGVASVSNSHFEALFISGFET